MPVILVTWEAEVRRSRQIVHEIPMSNITREKVQEAWLQW
jgi:hypothetical protein